MTDFRLGWQKKKWKWPVGKVELKLLPKKWINKQNNTQEVMMIKIITKMDNIRKKQSIQQQRQGKNLSVLTRSFSQWINKYIYIKPMKRE